MAPSRAVRIILLLLATTFVGGRVAADGTTGVTTPDAFAKQLEDEWNELGKKKETLKGVARRFEILKEIARAPSGTAQKFLLGLVRKSSTLGDHRFHALLALVKMADASALETTLATLVKEKDATLWEGFAEALADAPSDAVSAWQKGPALGAREPETLCAVLRALAKRPDPAAAEKISALYAKHAKPPGSTDVAHASLRALSKTSGAIPRATLLDAARHADARVRLAAAEELPFVEPFDAEVESAVRGMLQDESIPVRTTAAAGAGAAKRGALAVALVAMLADPRVRARHVASKALEQISGLALGHDVKAWGEWLAKRDPGKPEQATVPSYHGFSVYSDRVVFLVDASDSMLWPFASRNRPPQRIDVAKSELASVLHQLTPDTLFNVIVFNDKQISWRKAEAPATAENVASATQFAEKAMAKPSGNTHFYEALETAFENDPQFDTIYLLTDGNPTDGKYWTNEAVLASVRAWTRGMYGFALGGTVVGMTRHVALSGWVRS